MENEMNSTQERKSLEDDSLVDLGSDSIEDELQELNEWILQKAVSSVAIKVDHLMNHLMNHLLDINKNDTQENDQKLLQIREKVEKMKDDFMQRFVDFMQNKLIQKMDHFLDDEQNVNKLMFINDDQHTDWVLDMNKSVFPAKESFVNELKSTQDVIEKDLNHFVQENEGMKKRLEQENSNYMHVSNTLKKKVVSLINDLDTFNMQEIADLYQ